MQRVGIFQIDIWCFYDPLAFTCLAPFFKGSIVKNQRFDSVANSQLVPNDFQLSKALNHLGFICKKFKTWGTNCELDPEPIFWNFPNENWEICEKQSKTGKSMAFDIHLFGI